MPPVLGNQEVLIFIENSHNFFQETDIRKNALLYTNLKKNPKFP